MQLRYYQRAAIEATYTYLRTHDDNPCIVVPTGGGKTPIISTIAKDAVSQWQGRVIILSHVKELLLQNLDKLVKIAPELAPQIGVFSAGIGQKDTDKDIIIAGIQSAANAPERFGKIDLAIVDEAHLIKTEAEGRYRAFLDALKKQNPALRVIGLTATPYRLDAGTICAPEYILNNISYQIGIAELVSQGYLSPLVSAGGASEVDTSQLHVTAGEFDQKEAEDAFVALVQDMVAETVKQAAGRNRVLVFTQSIKTMELVAEKLRGWNAGGVETVWGDQLPQFREQAIARFVSGESRFLVNVNVLTTGFDCPSVDCVALMRATVSPGLYYQMCGRGFRIAEGKRDCLILDFGQNIQRHGALNIIEPQAKQKKQKRKEREDEVAKRQKKCPKCLSFVEMRAPVCPYCGHLFSTLTAKSDREKIIEDFKPEIWTVNSIEYEIHKSPKGEGFPDTLQVTYHCNFGDIVKEWVCFDHEGYAREKARKWWTKRAIDNPEIPEAISVADAYHKVAVNGWLNEPRQIKVQKDPMNPKYWRMLDVVEFAPAKKFDTDNEIPF